MVVKSADDPKKIREENEAVLKIVNDYIAWVDPDTQNLEEDMDLRNKIHFMLLKATSHHEYFKNLDDEQRKGLILTLLFHDKILGKFHLIMKQMLAEMKKNTEKEPPEPINPILLREFMSYRDFLWNTQKWLSEHSKNSLDSGNTFQFTDLESLPAHPKFLRTERAQRQSLTDDQIDKIQKENPATGVYWIVSTIGFVGGLLAGLVAKIPIPPIPFVCQPLSNGFKTLGYGAWRASIVDTIKHDQSMPPEKKERIEQAIRTINRRNKWSSYLGGAGSAALLISIFVAGGPIAAVVGFAGVLISNSFWTAAVYRDYKKEMLHGKQDSMRNLRINMHRGELVYASASVFSGILFTVAAITVAFFPPAAAVIALPFFYMGIAAAVVSVGGWITQQGAILAQSYNTWKESPDKDKASWGILGRIFQFVAGKKVAETDQNKEAVTSGLSVGSQDASIDAAKEAKKESVANTEKETLKVSHQEAPATIKPIDIIEFPLRPVVFHVPSALQDGPPKTPSKEVPAVMFHHVEGLRDPVARRDSEKQETPDLHQIKVEEVSRDTEKPEGRPTTPEKKRPGPPTHGL